MKIDTEIKIGDRVKIPSWGWHKATVIQLAPQLLLFDGQKEPTRTSAELAPLHTFPELQPGKLIQINDLHFVAVGRKYVIERVEEDGWILTTDNQLFHRNYFDILD